MPRCRGFRQLWRASRRTPTSTSSSSRRGHWRPPRTRWPATWTSSCSRRDCQARLERARRASSRTPHTSSRPHCTRWPDRSADRRGHPDPEEQREFHPDRRQRSTAQPWRSAYLPASGRVVRAEPGGRGSAAVGGVLAGSGASADQRVGLSFDGSGERRGATSAPRPGAARALMRNAVKYSPPGSSPRRLAGEREAVVVVADDGPGIPDGELSHVFDRFHRGRGRGDDDRSGPRHLHRA